MFIMSEKKTEDRVLDELLNNMPKFTDKRSKDEMYKLVKSKIEIQERPEKRNRLEVSMNKWLPFIISVASVLILTVLVSSFINKNESSTADKAQESSMEKDHMRTMDVPEEASMATEEDKSSDMSTMSGKIVSSYELVPFDSLFTSVYENDLNGGTVFHFSLLENALSIQ